MHSVWQSAGSRKVRKVELLGYKGELKWKQDESALRVEMPRKNSPTSALPQGRARVGNNCAATKSTLTSMADSTGSPQFWVLRLVLAMLVLHNQGLSTVHQHHVR